MESDFALNFAADHARGGEQMSPRLREAIERGRAYTALDYNRALAARAALLVELDDLFMAYDAIVTPATTGEAPKGLDSTGNPIFCTIWTLCGVPAVTLPLMKGENGMPIGVQVVGRSGDDARLLRTARWLAESAFAPAPKRRRKN
jgi:Asp-tRNA(Asn)/Glu-tRNA(Gln) amidotransferase A subunit family amidase